VLKDYLLPKLKVVELKEILRLIPSARITGNKQALLARIVDAARDGLEQHDVALFRHIWNSVCHLAAFSE
jgi:hypothetical protein